MPMSDLPRVPQTQPKPLTGPRDTFARAPRAAISSVAQGGDEGLALLRLVAAFDRGSAEMIEAHARSPRSQQQRGRS
jgi:hypothetical protein